MYLVNENIKKIICKVYEEYGDILCDKCGGGGSRRTVAYNGRCKKCDGLGKINWIRKITKGD